MKWLKGKIKCIAVGNTGSSVARDIGDFCAPRCPAPVLILSYETFRTYKKQFYAEGKVDLLICDEAHRSVALLSSKHRNSNRLCVFPLSVDSTACFAIPFWVGGPCCVRMLRQSCYGVCADTLMLTC